MSRVPSALLALLLLAACSGNPFEEPDTTTDPDRELPDGTEEPKAKSAIIRYEPEDTDKGNGYVTSVSYDKKSDTFQVDNLPFDGVEAYKRGKKVSSFGDVNVYEGAAAVDNIDQLQHRALYGVSKDGQVEFAIVRTGGYINYGFGGFIYQRNSGVTLPAEGKNTEELRGQAQYAGKFTSLRDHQARSGLEYGRADMTMDIDYDDFNDGNGVKGRIYNRKIYDINGNDITANIVAALSAEANAAQDRLPEIVFNINAGAMDDNGEMAGTASSSYYNGDGALEGFEEGNYYAVLQGDDANKVVGVVVVEGDDPRWDGVTTRETGGFILRKK